MRLGQVRLGEKHLVSAAVGISPHADVSVVSGLRIHLKLMTMAMITTEEVKDEPTDSTVRDYSLTERHGEPD